MRRAKRFVFDTNVIISALILPNSKPRLAFDKALKKNCIVTSDDTIFELSEKILLEKFDKYVLLKERMLFLQWFKKSSEQVTVSEKITLCRDPDDDKFLSLAKTARASAIVSGDKDLLVLKSFENIPIINPDEFLKKF